MSEAEPEIVLRAADEDVDMDSQEEELRDGLAADLNNNDLDSSCPPAKRQKQSRVQCPVVECDDSFARPSALKRHWIRKHLEYENAYVCRFEKCKYKTDRRENMERHIEKIHQKAVRDRTRLSIEVLKIRMCAIPNDKYVDPIIDPPLSIQPLPGPCDQMLPSKPPVDPYWRKHGYSTPMHHPDYVPPSEDPFKVPAIPKKSAPKLSSIVVSIDNLPVSDNVMSAEIADDLDTKYNPLINDVSMQHTATELTENEPVNNISFVHDTDTAADYREQQDAVAKVLHDLQASLSQEGSNDEVSCTALQDGDQSNALFPPAPDVRLFESVGSSMTLSQNSPSTQTVSITHKPEDLPDPDKPTLAFIREYQIPRNACYLDGEEKEPLPTKRESLIKFYKFADHWAKYWTEKASECKSKLKDIETQETKALKAEVSQLRSRNLELEERLRAVRGVLRQSEVPL